MLHLSEYFLDINIVANRVFFHTKVRVLNVRLSREKSGGKTSFSLLFFFLSRKKCDWHHELSRLVMITFENFCCHDKKVCDHINKEKCLLMVTQMECSKFCKSAWEVHYFLQKKIFFSADYVNFSLRKSHKSFIWARFFNEINPFSRFLEAPFLCAVIEMQSFLGVDFSANEEPCKNPCIFNSISHGCDFFVSFFK